MIGLFGLYNFDKSAPADPLGMVQRLPSHLAVHSSLGVGASIGHASHGGTCITTRAISELGVSVYVSGWISNCEEFTVPGCPNPEAADVVLHLIKQGDYRGLGRINGQFCAAIYDENKHSLTLVTDRNGTFPLYVWKDAQGVAFASQLYVLNGLDRIPKTADCAAIVELFTMQRTLGDSTPISGVKALPSACLFTVSQQGASQSTYWNLEWSDPSFSKKECSERLAMALRNAVQRQVKVTKKSGLLLSGGLDSRMIISVAPPGSLSCWTTAGYEANPELALARRIAQMFNAEHHACIVPPEQTFDFLDSAVIACGGLYPASTPVAAFLPDVDDDVTMLLTGHGLDYTLRGYYLPSRFLNIAGSKTRLPTLRPIVKNPTGHDVLASLRQGPPRKTINAIIAEQKKQQWWHTIGEKLGATLAPWLQSEQPYNAWDAFILGNVSKHYAFTSMMAVRDKANLANPAFDNEVFDIYLQMPPAWRCEGRVLQKAMQLMSKECANIPNANTHFPGDLHPWVEISALLGRGALRRMKIAGRHKLPSQQHSEGSWQNVGALMRDEPKHRARLRDIQGRLDSVCFNLIDSTALSKCIDDHLDGSASHMKLLRQLLTHDSWVNSFGIVGHD